MKKLLVLIFVLIVLGGAAVAAFLFLNKSSTPMSTLIKEEGSVSFKKKESDQYTELSQDEVKLENGSFIKTDADSYARVFLPDNSMISMDVNTEIQINFEDNKTNIEQLVGKTWHRVQTLTNGEEYKVQTPNTVAAVRGTIFGVGVDNDTTSRVFVEENRVNVGGEIDLEEGKQANAIDDDLSEQETDAALKASFWYQRNKIIDEEWQKVKNSSNLQKDLQKKLEERPDFETLKLGLKPLLTDNASIQKELANAYRLAKIDANTCANNTREQMEDAYSSVERYREYVQNADDVLALLYTIKEACRDGSFSEEELVFLQGLVEAANADR